jgi:hypothetical protein
MLSIFEVNVGSPESTGRNKEPIEREFSQEGYAGIITQDLSELGINLDASLSEIVNRINNKVSKIHYRDADNNLTLYESLLHDDLEYYIIVKDNNTHALLKYTLGTEMPTDGKIKVKLNEIISKKPAIVKELPEIHIYFNNSRPEAIQIGKFYAMGYDTRARSIDENRHQIITRLSKVDVELKNEYLTMLFDNYNEGYYGGIPGELPILENILRLALKQDDLVLTKDRFTNLFSGNQVPFILQRIIQLKQSNDDFIKDFLDISENRYVLESFLFDIEALYERIGIPDIEKYHPGFHEHNTPEQASLRGFESFQESRVIEGLGWRMQKIEEVENRKTIYIELSHLYGNPTLVDDLLNLDDRFLSSFTYVLRKLYEVVGWERKPVPDVNKLRSKGFDTNRIHRYYRLQYLKAFVECLKIADLDDQWVYLGDQTSILQELEGVDQSIFNKNEASIQDILSYHLILNEIRKPNKSIIIPGSIFASNKGKKMIIGKFIEEISRMTKSNMPEIIVVFAGETHTDINEDEEVISK